MDITMVCECECVSVNVCVTACCVNVNVFLVSSREFCVFVSSCVNFVCVF